MTSAVLDFSGASVDSKSSLINPLSDFLLICGGLMWCLFAVHQLLPAVGSGQASFGAAALVLSVMLAESHVMATLVRLYESKALKQKHPAFIRFGPLALLVFVALLCLLKDFLSLVTLIYVFASIHHGLRQSYGIVLLYCMRTGCKLLTAERQLLSLFLHSVTLFAVLRQMAFSEFARSPLKGVDLIVDQTVPEGLVLVLGFVCALLGMLFLLSVLRERPESSSFPVLASLLILNAVLVVVFSREIAGDLWIFVPGFFHGLQYLAITVVHRIGMLRQAQPQASTSANISQYLLMLLVMSFLVYGLGPIILQHCGVSFYTAAAAIFLAFVLHHIWADALIWRLKDPSLLKAFQLAFSATQADDWSAPP